MSEAGGSEAAGNEVAVNDVAVIGAGAWGTALALLAARTQPRVTLWARDPAMARRIGLARLNPRLPGVALPANIDVTDRMEPAAITLLAVPVQHAREVAARLPGGGLVVLCGKGLELATLCLPLEVMAQLWPERAALVLSGPNFAHEIAAGLPAASLVAGGDATDRDRVVAALAGPAFRLYTSTDAVGAQIGGAAKNVIAIAAGIVIGAGLGENARAALVTRGLAEIARLATALGGLAETVAGLSGLGDLMLTCTGPASRNFSYGLALGGGTLAPAFGVVEGVATAPALVARAKLAAVDLPICSAVARLLEGELSVAEAVSALLARPLREE